MFLVATNMSQVGRAIDSALLKYKDEIVKVCMDATQETAYDISEEARTITPVQTGTLLRSAMAGGPWRVWDTAESEAGYTAPYAGKVHEDMEGHMPKFLEKAVISVGPRLRRHVVKGLKRK